MVFCEVVVLSIVSGPAGSWSNADFARAFAASPTDLVALGIADRKPGQQDISGPARHFWASKTILVRHWLLHASGDCGGTLLRSPAVQEPENADQTKCLLMVTLFLWGCWRCLERPDWSSLEGYFCFGNVVLSGSLLIEDPLSRWVPRDVGASSMIIAEQELPAEQVADLRNSGQPVPAFHWGLLIGGS